MLKVVNGVEVEMTAEEIAARLAELAAYAPPPPAPKKLSVWISNMHVDGQEVAAVGVDNGISFAFFISETEIMAFFVEPIADLNYGWNVSSTIGTAHVTARDEYSLTITVADTVEPFDMSVQIYGLI